MWIGIVAALAEPPPYVELADGLRQADQVWVGEAIRLEYQTLKPGESLTTSTRHAPWVMYRVDQVLRGDPAWVGRWVRVHSLATACIAEPLVIRREEDTFFEVRGAEEPTPFDPEARLPKGPQLLVVERRDEAFHHVAPSVSPLPFDRTRAREVERLLNSRGASHDPR